MVLGPEYSGKISLNAIKSGIPEEWVKRFFTFTFCHSFGRLSTYFETLSSKESFPVQSVEKRLHRSLILK
jgi:hypothetical protein